MDINNMTQLQFQCLPHRKWDEDIGVFDSLIILPAGVNALSLLKYKIWRFLSSHISWIKAPELHTVNGMHDSGYRLLDFVAVKDQKPICRLSGCSDVIHIEGIGGLGFDWLHRYTGVPDLVPPTDWSIDCLKRSGLLRMFCRGGIRVGSALSSFEIYQQIGGEDNG